MIEDAKPRPQLRAHANSSPQHGHEVTKNDLDPRTLPLYATPPLSVLPFTLPPGDCMSAGDDTERNSKSDCDGNRVQTDTVLVSSVGGGGSGCGGSGGGGGGAMVAAVVAAVVP